VPGEHVLGRAVFVTDGDPEKNSSILCEGYRGLCTSAIVYDKVRGTLHIKVPNLAKHHRRIRSSSVMNTIAPSSSVTSNGFLRGSTITEDARAVECGTTWSPMSQGSATEDGVQPRAWKSARSNHNFFRPPTNESSHAAAPVSLKRGLRRQR